MSNLSSKKNKLTAGWLIVIACMFIQAIPAGVIANTQALFIHPVITERGFSLASLHFQTCRNNIPFYSNNKTNQHNIVTLSLLPQLPTIDTILQWNISGRS